VAHPQHQVRPPVAETQERPQLRALGGDLDRLVEEGELQPVGGGLERRALIGA